MKIGVVVNPVAGMGGAVGLKGTDGQVAEAIHRGAVPVAPDRASRLLSLIRPGVHTFLTAGGPMGEGLLAQVGIPAETVYQPKATETTAEDTRRACRTFCDRGVELILFCGGDGTARDVFAVVGDTIPILGVPSGVKMYSGVFAPTPAAAAECVNRLDEAVMTDAEVMDIDEEAYREGRLSVRLAGIARSPALTGHLPSSKWATDARHEARAQADIARFIGDIMRDDTLYLIGAGSTTAAVIHALGEEGTLLGIDAVYDGDVIARDLNEEGILRLLDEYPLVQAIISPIGAQGFVLGRGTQQVSPAVVRRIGPENFIIIATEAKLSRTPTLYLDTGDPDQNQRFPDFVQVVCGYAMARRMPLLHES
ncbi:ATP-NAD kinase family protein [Methanogenium organophilum]|uniref:ATP-NAD kinase family protein n=1 Tax=Methanogenium organophilum TaxID=2199 RepID=A0A9X9T9D2_METOG|nr:ATP-NAD kinase family protein [Methanogenium organophilum]WAI02515.1 ATP-NAD kinase family protein [Methanogenium organophilum]